jgi:hypothetical protein
MAAQYRDGRRDVAAMVLARVGADAEHLHTNPEVMASFLMAVFDRLVLQ